MRALGAVMSDLVTFERDDAIGTITLRRPDKFNALDLPMLRALEAALDMAEIADGVRVVLVRGVGKGFCAGGDVDAWSQMSAADFLVQWVRYGHRVFDRLARLRQPTIAVLSEHGWAGVTLERVAEKVGRSRVTLWRQGLTVESLLSSLLDALADDYRDTMWPVLAGSGTGREGLIRTLEALFDVIDRHLPLMLSSDLVFHQEQARNGPVSFLDPFERFLREEDASAPKKEGQ